MSYEERADGCNQALALNPPPNVNQHYGDVSTSIVWDYPPVSPIYVFFFRQRRTQIVHTLDIVIVKRRSPSAAISKVEDGCA